MKDQYTFGVVGHRISYSGSPKIFQSIADILRFKHTFELHDIAPDDFDVEFPIVLKSGIDGFSVTIPHKNSVMPLLNEIDPAAEQVGAVNSVCVRDGRSIGFNTDGDGFAVPLEKHRNDLKSGVALLVGAGGAAKAVAHCLHNRFAVNRFIVLGRDAVKLDAFCDSLSNNFSGTDIVFVRLDDYDSVAREDYSIVVNCTPLGGWNHPDESPFPANFNWLPEAIYYDLSYNARHKIVESARQKGLTAYDGSAMLIGQALRSLYLWTGLEVEFEPVYKAVFGQK